MDKYILINFNIIKYSFNITKYHKISYFIFSPARLHPPPPCRPLPPPVLLERRLLPLLVPLFVPLPLPLPLPLPDLPLTRHRLHPLHRPILNNPTTYQTFPQFLLLPPQRVPMLDEILVLIVSLQRMIVVYLFDVGEGVGEEGRGVQSTGYFVQLRTGFRRLGGRRRRGFGF